MLGTIIWHYTNQTTSLLIILLLFSTVTNMIQTISLMKDAHYSIAFFLGMIAILFQVLATGIIALIFKLSLIETIIFFFNLAIFSLVPPYPALLTWIGVIVSSLLTPKLIVNKIINY